jgi:hypothetical protein
MSRWIVKSAPLGPSAAGTIKEETFATDGAAKAHVRDMVRQNYALKVRSSPGVKPVREMGHAEALQWAYD